MEEFYMIVRDILPDSIRIAKELTRHFASINFTILQKISSNMQLSGNPEILAFWNNEQFCLAENCLSFKRVLLASAYSTGKTTLMMDCIKKLQNSLGSATKILFLFNSTSSIIQYPTLLQRKMQMFFKNGVKFNFVDYFDKSGTQRLIEQHHNYNVFIDELSLQRIGKEDIKSWSKIIDNDKHFWVIVGYGKCKGFDAMEEFHVPVLKHPLRNPREIVEFVKDNAATSNEYFYGNDPDSIEKLVLPTNMIRSFSPIIIEAKNVREGFQSSIHILDKEFAIMLPTLFLLGNVQSDIMTAFSCPLG